MNINKKALLIDKIDRGTIKTTLETNGYEYILKLPLSSVNNWSNICKILEDDREDNLIIIGKFTENVLFQLCAPSYRWVKETFLMLLKRKKHLLFIYKDNLFGKFSFFAPVNESVFDIDEQNDYLKYNYSKLSNWIRYQDINEEEEIYFKKVNEFIKYLNENFNILPYERLIDVENAGQNFIENSAEGLLFRIYVPNERIWSSEFDKFINLFRDYASSVANIELTVKQNRTDLGIVCSMYSRVHHIDENEMNRLYKEFTAFMDLCASDPEEAMHILNSKEISNDSKQKIISKYVKESKRLLLDLKHERETKLLTIKQKLENELQEGEINDEIVGYIESWLPKVTSTSNVLHGSSVQPTNVININPQFIQTVNGIVSKEINGTINFSTEEEEFLKLIEKYAEKTLEVTDLKSALYELKDKVTGKEEKRSAWQKLYGFLGKVADKVGDVGVALLSKYLEQKIYGS